MDSGTLVKICGITSWEDAKAAVDAGADMLGFVLTEESPRYIAPHRFWEIAVRLPSRIVRVGVFDGMIHQSWCVGPREIYELFHRIQYYHDSIWPEILRENWDMHRKIKAFSLHRPDDLRRIAEFNGLAQAYLLNVNADSPAGYADPLAYGWELAREVRQFGKRLYLAGGLTPENVGQAVSSVWPYAVDVNLGVEASPGVKDPEKMHAFVRAVRQVSG